MKKAPRTAPKRLFMDQGSIVVIAALVVLVAVVPPIAVAIAVLAVVVAVVPIVIVVTAVVVAVAAVAHRILQPLLEARDARVQLVRLIGVEPVARGHAKPAL